MAFAIAQAQGRDPIERAMPAFSAAGHLPLWLETNDTYLDVPDAGGVFSYLKDDEQQTLIKIGARRCVPISGTEGLLAILVLIDDRPDWRVPSAQMKRLTSFLKDVSSSYQTAHGRLTRTSAMRSLHRAGQLVVAGQLAATIAHEVRNPLASLRSTIQYVIDSQSSWPTKQELLHDSFRELDRINDTISGVLTLSRPPELLLTDAVVPRLASDAMRLMRTYADDHGITLEADLDTTFSSMIDVREIHQVFINLFLNACQAMGSGGRLAVSSRIEDLGELALPSKYGVVHIQDSGPGIPASDLDKVFEPFFTTKATGTGLGLPVCLEIVARHGGHLDLRCPPEGGTIASVHLPLSQESSGLHPAG
jgi:signal transduction histidine kinase